LGAVRTRDLHVSPTDDAVDHVTSIHRGGHLRRSGLLIGTREETDVTAVHYGRVVFSNWLRGFGLMTIIDHGDGYMSLYGHSSSLLKSPGDWVTTGEAIAVSGQSGGTEDPVVYFEIRYNGKPQNPQKWLKSR
jgi:septal ring factor EnvC (AmiA/AmiB activator)